MKSIKEKAKWESADPFEQEWFEAGANYVLEEIEKIVKYDKDPHCIEFLKELIWRLKQ